MNTTLLTACQHGVASHFAYPATNAPRFFLPLQKQAANAGLLFFLSTKKRIALAARHLTSRLLGHAKACALETELLTQVKAFACHPSAFSIVSVGTPGPYNKHTVLLVDANGFPLSLAKVASTPAAVTLLENEAHWLTYLGGSNNLKDRIPDFAGSQHFSSGSFVLLQSIGIGSQAGNPLQEEHVRFINDLHEFGSVSRSYLASDMRKAMYARLEKVGANLSSAWSSRAEKSLKILDEQLVGAELPMLAAHRDFAPWNTRQTAHGLFVFDWEYASEDYVPLYDLFHYVLMPAASRKDLTTSDARAALRTILAFEQLLGENKTTMADFQLLAYLIDLCLFYLDSNNGRDIGDKIVYRYATLIDTFSDWRHS